jgi:FkbM family methyltransferase
MKNKPIVFPLEYRKIETNIIENIKYINNVDIDKYITGYPINIYWTFNFIEVISSHINFDEIRCIFDIGSRDGHQSVEFRNWFPDARIVAFEANPNQIGLISDVVNGYNIEIVNKAVGDYDGKASFFISDVNVGSSSLYKINDHIRSRDWKQSEIEVEIIRIDDWCKKSNVDKIDILWVDVQGAEKVVFGGIGEYLYDVKAICTEVGIDHIYENSTIKDELDEYLKSYGFIEIISYHFAHKEVMDIGIDDIPYEYLKSNIGEIDVIYINKKYIKNL